MATDHQGFFASLSPEERQLLTIRDELYLGSWEEMKQDLEDRKNGKPFIFKLANKIEEDLGRIERLSQYEAQHDVDLGQFLQ